MFKNGLLSLLHAKRDDTSWNHIYIRSRPETLPNTYCNNTSVHCISLPDNQCKRNLKTYKTQRYSVRNKNKSCDTIVPHCLVYTLMVIDVVTLLVSVSKDPFADLETVFFTSAGVSTLKQPV